MNFRRGTLADAAVLAKMNYQLIRDERHRNSMTLAELQARMEGWLAGDYQAVVFEDNEPSGYALFRFDDDHVYLRQFFVRRELRRQGVGRSAIEWLVEHTWRGHPRVRIEVLAGNQVGIEFWRSVGFADYSLTMERPL